MKIYVRALTLEKSRITCDDAVLEVQPSWTVEYLKHALMTPFSFMLPQSVFLVAPGGLVMEDSRTLEDYNVQKLDRLHAWLSDVCISKKLKQMRKAEAEALKQQAEERQKAERQAMMDKLRNWAPMIDWNEAMQEESD